MRKHMMTLVLGMGVGMFVMSIIEKNKNNSSSISSGCKNCSCENDETNEKSQSSNESNSNNYLEMARQKLNQAITEFNNIDLSKVKTKTKEALDSFKCKLESINL